MFEDLVNNLFDSTEATDKKLAELKTDAEAIDAKHQNESEAPAPNAKVVEFKQPATRKAQKRTTATKDSTISLMGSHKLISNMTATDAKLAELKADAARIRAKHNM